MIYCPFYAAIKLNSSTRQLNWSFDGPPLYPAWMNTKVISNAKTNRWGGGRQARALQKTQRETISLILLLHAKVKNVVTSVTSF